MQKVRLKKAEASTPESLLRFGMMITMTTKKKKMMVVIMLLTYARCFCVYCAHDRHVPLHFCVVGSASCPT